VNSTQVLNVLGHNAREELDSTTWFPAAAGLTFVLLGVLRYVRQAPRDKWELFGILNLTIGGLIYIPLSIMDIGSRRQIETVHGLTAHLNAAIWRFTKSGWPLPSFAILTILVTIGDAVCNFKARQSLRRQVGSDDPHIYAPMFGEKLHPQYPASDRPDSSVDDDIGANLTRPVPHPAP